MAITLKANQRKDLKQSATRELRLNGNVPSVVYGKEKEPITVAVNSIELLKTVRDEGRTQLSPLISMEKIKWMLCYMNIKSIR